MFRKIKNTCMVLLLLLFVVSCSKDNDGPDIGGGKGGLTMMIDGKPVNFNFAWVATDYEDALEDGDKTFTITGVASSIDLSGKDLDKVNTESIMFGIEVPIGKFKNPQGTYNLGDSHDGMMIYYKASAKNVESSSSMSDLIMYASVDPKDKQKVMGKFTINSVKIGSQGIVELGEGYTELVATFDSELALYYDGQDPDTVEGAAPSLVVKNGKVTFKSVLSGLFGGFLGKKQ